MENLKKFIGKESVRSGIKIAMTIGIIGSMLGLIAYDHYVNDDSYQAVTEKNEEYCSVNPDECLENFGLYMNW